MIESFRNELWPGYKTGEGIDPALWAQFPLLEEVLTRLRRARLADGRVRSRRRARGRGGDGRAGSARGARAHLLARQGPRAVRATATAWCSSIACAQTTRDEAGVVAKFGVPPASIPDYLALVGDSADGYPG